MVCEKDGFGQPFNINPFDNILDFRVEEYHEIWYHETCSMPQSARKSWSIILHFLSTTNLFKQLYNVKLNKKQHTYKLKNKKFILD